LLGQACPRPRMSWFSEALREIISAVHGPVCLFRRRGLGGGETVSDRDHAAWYFSAMQVCQVALGDAECGGLVGIVGHFFDLSGVNQLLAPSCREFGTDRQGGSLQNSRNRSDTPITGMYVGIGVKADFIIVPGGIEVEHAEQRPTQ